MNGMLVVRERTELKQENLSVVVTSMAGAARSDIEKESSNT